MMLNYLVVAPLTVSLAAAMILLVLIVLLIRKKQTNKYQYLKTLPGPRGLPILGASHILANARYKKHCDAFSDLRTKYGDIFAIKLGSRQCTVVSSLRAIKEVLITKSNDFANRPDFLRFHAIFKGDRNLSIALCDYSPKQQIRREIAFPFMHPRVKTLDGNRMNMYIMSELQELVKMLSEVNGMAIDPRPYLIFTTANIFFEYLCSKRFPSKDKNFQNMLKIYDLVFKELFQGFAVDFMPWLKVFNKQRLEELKDLAEHVSMMTSSIFSEHEEDFDAEKPPRDLVDIFIAYLKENEGSTSVHLNKEDAEVIIEDLIGGHSVLANLWLWGLYFLAVNPEVKQKIREETYAQTQNCRAPTLDDKHDMPYTEAVTMEILRWVSSPIIPHVATKDTSIEGYKIAKDTMVIFNTYDINMDPKLHPNPRQFNPERFISPEGRVCKPDFFLPFGTGKRTCLGDRLVRSILFLGLSTLLQNFDILTSEGIAEPEITEISGIVVPDNKILLTFCKLDSSTMMIPTTTIEMTS